MTEQAALIAIYSVQVGLGETQGLYK